MRFAVISAFLSIVTLLFIMDNYASAYGLLPGYCDRQAKSGRSAYGINFLSSNKDGTDIIDRIIAEDNDKEVYMHDITRSCIPGVNVRNGGLDIVASGEGSEFITISGGASEEGFITGGRDSIHHNTNLTRTIIIDIKKIHDKYPEKELVEINLEYFSWITAGNSYDEFRSSIAIEIIMPKKWQGKSQSYADKTTSRPRDTIKFSHRVWSDYQHNVGTLVGWRVRVRSKSGGNAKKVVDTGNSRQSLSEFIQKDNTYTVNNKDVGGDVCSEIYYSPASLNMEISTEYGQRAEDGGAVSREACVYIPYEYDIKLCLENCANGDIPGEPGETPPPITGVPVITGDDPDEARFIITKWKVDGSREGDPNTPIVDEKDSINSNTCQVYNSPKFFNGAMSRGSCSFVEGKGVKFEDPQPTIPDDAEIGARYCVGWSVSPYKLNKNQSREEQKSANLWYHSKPKCRIIVKKPKLQVWNNGIFARGGIQTGTSRLKGNIFGSWVEYEAISNGLISGFGTEGVVTGTNLSFSNTDRNKRGSFGGNFDDASSIISKIERTFGKNAKEDLSSRMKIEEISDKSEISVATVDSKFDTHVVYGKNVRISKDIRYSRIGQQLIIVADNIYIDPAVENIDAWLVAKGKVVTCADGFVDKSDWVNLTNCGKKLTVNGAILSSQLKSFRAFGDHTKGEPAEIYNQRPDMYYWGAMNFSGAGSFRSTYTKELPVRY